MECWVCEILGMWNVGDVGYLGCEMLGMGLLGMWDIGDVECSRCGILGT